jgi:hypothetical protein
MGERKEPHIENRGHSSEVFEAYFIFHQGMGTVILKLPSVHYRLEGMSKYINDAESQGSRMEWNKVRKNSEGFLGLKSSV